MPAKTKKTTAKTEPKAKPLPGFKDRLAVIAEQAENQAAPSLSTRSGLPLGAGSPIDGIRKGLRAAGFTPGQIFALLPVIIKLVQEYGPKVAEIIAELRKLFPK